jgi:hypothetical protein
MLVFIAIMMLARIEDTFNDIWVESRGRNWFARVTQYWAALTLGPVLFILVIGLTSSSELKSVQEKLLTMPLVVGAVTDIVFQVLPFALLSLGFAVFYALLPNTKVAWQAALAEGRGGRLPVAAQQPPERALCLARGGDQQGLWQPGHGAGGNDQPLFFVAHPTLRRAGGL